MLPVQPAVVHPNNVKSFPAATVPAAAKLGQRRGKRGTAARREYRLQSRQVRSGGVVKEPHPLVERTKVVTYVKTSNQANGGGESLGKTTAEAVEEVTPLEAPGRQGKEAAARTYVLHASHACNSFQRRQALATLTPLREPVPRWAVTSPGDRKLKETDVRKL